MAWCQMAWHRTGSRRPERVHAALPPLPPLSSHPGRASRSDRARQRPNSGPRVAPMPGHPGTRLPRSPRGARRGCAASSGRLFRAHEEEAVRRLRAGRLSPWLTRPIRGTFRRMTIARTAKRILWVDDEIELLRPHCLFLQHRGYHVDAISNGDDALTLLRKEPYDLVLLDEQMPGRRGLEVLEVLRREDPHARVVMVTKSEDDRTMTEAIERRVDDYLVKPTSPRQVLSVVTRILEGHSIRQQQAAQDFAGRFSRLSALHETARTATEFAALFSELTDWHIHLAAAGERGLLDSVSSQMDDLRKDFGHWIKAIYPRWMRGEEEPPLFSTDLVERYLLLLLGEDPVLLVVLDCMRLDQWRVLPPLLNPLFEITEGLHYSILPTATPYSRNAIFSGWFPDRISHDYPDWWGARDEEGGMNDFEDRLLAGQLERLTGRKVPVHYEKVFSDREGERLRTRVNSALNTKGSVVALVFNFMDLLIHTRGESPVFLEMARDEIALRDLTRSWMERSSLFQLFGEIAGQGYRVVVTTDHGSIQCNRPTTIHARKDATSNLRYKFGQNLQPEEPSSALVTADPADLRFPTGRMGTKYVRALEDFFLVYPTKLREYQSRYRGSFLHGGISPEEMIVPVATLTPRSR
ncbi:MAG: response regulator [Gemmatimonadetes bacterium]|nr:response regulator [Gemmatimonadota bacterium]